MYVCIQKMYKEYDIVKIRTLKEKSRDFDGTEHVKRPPQIGDEGANCSYFGSEKWRG
jgi:hypothetical protein